MFGADVNISDLNISYPVYIYDNEPRNQQIVARMQKVIDRKLPIVIFPSDIHEKDLNDMVLAGHDVQKIVESNIYDGLEAQLKFNTWKKV